MKPRTTALRAVNGKKKMTKPLSQADIEKVAFYRAEIERITGKMVSLRSREKYNETARELAKGANERRKKRIAVLQRKAAQFDALKERGQA